MSIYGSTASGANTVQKFLRDGTPNNSDELGGLPLTLNPDYVVYFNDFIDQDNDDSTGNWTFTEIDTDTGSGGSFGITAGLAKGVAAIVTNANALDSGQIQHKTEAFKLESGKKLNFKCRLKVDDASETALFVGLAITDTTGIDATDRVGFAIKEADADGSIYCQTVKNGTSTGTDTDSAINIADDTYIDLAIKFDGTNVLYYINGNKITEHSSNVPDDEELAVLAHIKNGSAAASTLSIDYFLVAQER
jgi:hypothetical protein